MMTFLELEDGRLIPATEVRWIGKDRSYIQSAESDYRTVSLRSYSGNEGELAKAFVADVERFLRAPVGLIPAATGTRFVQFDDDLLANGEGSDHWFTDIIAWAACVDGEVRPVTVSGVNDKISDPGAIQLPNVRVELAEVQRWETLEDYLSAKRAELQSAIAERAKKAESTPSSDT